MYFTDGEAEAQNPGLLAEHPGYSLIVECLGKCHLSDNTEPGALCGVGTKDRGY